MLYLENILTLAYTCINWPAPLSPQGSLSRICERRAANINGYMMSKNVPRCTYHRRFHMWTQL